RPSGGAGGGVAGVSRPRPAAPARPPERGEPAQTEGRWQGRYRQHKTYRYGKLSHLYCPLDVFTWSAFAVLAVELAKHVRWLNFVQPRGVDGGTHHLDCQLAILPQRRHSGPSPSSNGEKEQISKGVSSGYAQNHPSSSKNSSQKEYQLLSETEDFLCPPESDSHLSRLQDSSSRFHLGESYEERSEINPRHQQPTARYKCAEVKMEVSTGEETAVRSWRQTPLQARNVSSSPCLQHLDQPLASPAGQPALGLLHSWSTGSLRDLAGGSLHDIPSPAFSNGLTFKLQSFAWSSGTVLG
ncbi:hypothetical protein JRQ81_012822, partial [Phrynocephalus forsythii]